MVGQHLAEWQLEITLANDLRGRLRQIAMPNGYAKGTYQPRQAWRGAANPPFISHPGGTLRNGVPKVLGLDFRGQYPLGAYNPGQPSY